MLQKYNSFILLSVGMGGYALFILLRYIIPGHAEHASDFSYFVSFARIFGALIIIGVCSALILRYAQIANAVLIGCLSSAILFFLPMSLSPLIGRWIVWSVFGSLLGLLLVVFDMLLNKWPVRMRYRFFATALLAGFFATAVFGLRLILYNNGLIY